jgi:hypothetical protein
MKCSMQRVERQGDNRNMQRKKSKAKAGAEASAAQVARLAGISMNRVYRLRQEGRSDSEIIAASQQRREQQAVLRNLPAVPVSATNGHAATGAVSYSQSLAEKERWMAALRRLQYQERSGELVRACDVRLFCTRLLIEARDILVSGPSELADELAAETDAQRVQEILRRWSERVAERFYRLTLWAERPTEPEPEAA